MNKGGEIPLPTEIRSWPLNPRGMHFANETPPDRVKDRAEYGERSGAATSTYEYADQTPCANLISSCKPVLRHAVYYRAQQRQPRQPCASTYSISSGNGEGTTMPRGCLLSVSSAETSRNARYASTGSPMPPESRTTGPSAALLPA
jgi:hypothetical protein